MHTVSNDSVDVPSLLGWLPLTIKVGLDITNQLLIVRENSDVCPSARDVQLSNSIFPQIDGVLSVFQQILVVQTPFFFCKELCKLLCNRHRLFGLTLGSLLNSAFIRELSHMTGGLIQKTLEQ